MILSVLFLAIFALYLNVRPDVTTDTTPAGGGSDVEAPANPLVPTAPTTPEPTEEPSPTTEPEETTEAPEEDTDHPDDGQHAELPGHRDDGADDDRAERPDGDLGADVPDVPDRHDDRSEHLLAVPDRVTVTEAVPPSHDAATHRRARSSLCPARRRAFLCPHVP